MIIKDKHQLNMLELANQRKKDNFWKIKSKCLDDGKNKKLINPIKEEFFKRTCWFK